MTDTLSLNDLTLIIQNAIGAFSSEQPQRVTGLWIHLCSQRIVEAIVRLHQAEQPQNGPLQVFLDAFGRQMENCKSVISNEEWTKIMGDASARKDEGAANADALRTSPTNPSEISLIDLTALVEHAIKEYEMETGKSGFCFSSTEAADIAVETLRPYLHSPKPVIPPADEEILELMARTWSRDHDTSEDYWRQDIDDMKPLLEALRPYLRTTEPDGESHPIPEGTPSPLAAAALAVQRHTLGDWGLKTAILAIDAYNAAKAPEPVSSNRSKIRKLIVAIGSGDSFSGYSITEQELVEELLPALGVKVYVD